MPTLNKYQLPRLLWDGIQILSTIAIIAGSSIVLYMLRNILSAPVVALLYLIPVVITATFLGRAAGIGASVLAFLVFNYFFIPPYYTFRVNHAQDLLVMIVFLGVAILIGSLIARIQSNLVTVQAREMEALQLYELSVELGGKKDPAEIASVLAQRLNQLFDDVIIHVEFLSGNQYDSIFLPEHIVSIDPGWVPFVVPLLIQDRSLGNITIYSEKNGFRPEEERLIRTFAHQGAIALDRAILLSIETQTRIFKESDRIKTAILSSVSHELRTPLASIQAAGTSLFNPEVNLAADARLELQSILLEETENMAQLVGNLLNMSRLEAGSLNLQRQWNSLSEIVDTCLRRIHRATQNHHILVEVSDDLPLLFVDAVLIEQVFINLIRNSVKYAPLDTNIEIKARVSDEVVRVQISNQGPGIPPEHIDQIFDKFHPIPGRDSMQGTGLGLSICKGIVESHGGQIHAENLEEGVAFIFTLPVSWNGETPVKPLTDDEDR